jgi:hypothetical protein
LYIQAALSKLLKAAWRKLPIRRWRLRLNRAILRPCRRTSRNGTHADYGRGKISEHAFLPEKDVRKEIQSTNCCNIAAAQLSEFVMGLSCAQWSADTQKPPRISLGSFAVALGLRRGLPRRAVLGRSRAC